MGGSSGKSQKRANAAQEQKNAVNQRQMDKDRAQMDIMQRKTDYTSGYNERTGKARTDAQRAVTQRRTKGLKDNSNLISDYHTQNRARLFRAKTGQGQTAEDTINKGMVDKAQNFLDRDSDYWDSTRTVEGDKAFNKAKDAYIKEHGTWNEGALSEKGLMQGLLDANKKGSDLLKGKTGAASKSPSSMLNPSERIRGGHGEDYEATKKKAKGGGSNSLFNKKRNNGRYGSNSGYSLGG